MGVLALTASQPTRLPFSEGRQTLRAPLVPHACKMLQCIWWLLRPQISSIIV